MDETPNGTAAGTADWAICCSGGGIRSATYCLGALQSLARGLYPRTRWIVGVSGGSYIAASLSLVRHNLSPQHTQAAYARGSAEEQHLRDNTRYIAPDAKTVLVGALSLLLGVAVTFTLVMAPVYALSHVWGWLLRTQGILTWTRTGASASVMAWSWWLAPAAAAGLTLILFIFWWATLPARGALRGAQRARRTGWAAAITAALALAMLAAPPVIAWLYHSTGTVGTIVHAIGFGGTGHWSFGTLGSLAAALVAAAGWCRTRLARVKAAQTQQDPAASTGVVTTVARWVVSHLTPWLASAVVVAIGLVAALTWIGAAAHTGYTPGQLVPVAVALAIMLSTRAVADINRLSLHDVYRWRLSTAYAVTRAACEATDPVRRAELLAGAARTRLSELAADEAPGLVICTTANINASGDVRPGQGGYCLAFDPEKTTLRGAPGSAVRCESARTADYENLAGLTLFDLVAISGAAVSPLMGSATKIAYRILLTATNVRLGVWLPHPRVLRHARAYLDGPFAREKDSWWARPVCFLLLWYVLPHPHWHAGQRQKERAERREARLWAHVLQARADATAGRRQRLGALICWRVMQPTMGLLWAEAAGHTSYRATWINVTDGGHYDNLGLVEALRRQETAQVLVLDASGDQVNTWSTLGGAMSLARIDASVEIDLKPNEMIDDDGPHLAAGEVTRPWAARLIPAAGYRRHGQAVGLQARLVERRGLGHRGLRQEPPGLPVRAHPAAAVRRVRVRGLPRAGCARRGRGHHRRQAAQHLGPAQHLRPARDPKPACPPGRTRRPQPGGNAAVIRSTTSWAVSAQAVVPPLAYSLTPSPTFHRFGIGVAGARSNPATARCGGQSSRVTTVDSTRARAPKPGITSSMSANNWSVSAASSKSPTDGCGTPAATYRFQPSGAISGHRSVKLAM